MPKILIIEDEPDIAKALAKRLFFEGYDVVTAVDAYQGVTFAVKEKPDLLILDLMLPAGGGLSALKNIRASGSVVNLPVVILTGMQNEDYEKKVRDEGVDAYVQKPYDFTELKGIIRDLLNKKGS